MRRQRQKVKLSDQHARLLEMYHVWVSYRPQVRFFLDALGTKFFFGCHTFPFCTTSYSGELCEEVLKFVERMEEDEA